MFILNLFLSFFSCTTRRSSRSLKPATGHVAPAKRSKNTRCATSATLRNRQHQRCRRNKRRHCTRSRLIRVVSWTRYIWKRSARSSRGRRGRTRSTSAISTWYSRSRRRRRLPGYIRASSAMWASSSRRSPPIIETRSNDCTKNLPSSQIRCELSRSMSMFSLSSLPNF